MNFFEAQDLFKRIHPDKKVFFEFDERCHRKHEIIYTEGVPHLVHHVENHHVKVTVEGQQPVYVPIEPHRECYAWANMKAMLTKRMAMNDVFLPPANIKELKELSPDDLEKACQERATMAGLPLETIKKKVLS